MVQWSTITPPACQHKQPLKNDPANVKHSQIALYLWTHAGRIEPLCGFNRVDAVQDNIARPARQRIELVLQVSEEGHLGGLQPQVARRADVWQCLPIGAVQEQVIKHRGASAEDLVDHVHQGPSKETETTSNLSEKGPSITSQVST